MNNKDRKLRMCRIGWSTFNNEHGLHDGLSVSNVARLNARLIMLISDIFLNNLMSNKISAEELVVKAVRLETNMCLEKNGYKFKTTYEATRDYLEVWPEIVVPVVNFVNVHRSMRKGG